MATDANVTVPAKLGIDANLRPRFIRAFFLLVLRELFKESEDYPFVPDKAKTEIFIQEEFPEDSKYEDILPCIVVETNGIAYNNDSIGNTHSITYPKPYQPTMTKQFTVTGNINVHCIVESRIDSEELACDVARMLITMRDPAMAFLHLQFMTMPQQSKAVQSRREGWAGVYDSVVSIQFTYAMKISTTNIDTGELLTAIEVYMANEQKSAKEQATPDSPNAQTFIPPGTPISGGGNGNSGNGTNTGGNTGGSDNGNGGSGFSSSTNPYGDWVYLNFVISKNDVTGEQQLPS